MSNALWWNRETHQARRQNLLKRGRIKRALQAWFEEEHGFLEVECAALQISPGNETHLHAFATEFVGEDGVKSPLFLHTSPEFACKKLLAAGEAKIFDFARAYRNREHSALHSPEFTMLEWYRIHADLSEVMSDCISICRNAARIAGVSQFRWKNRTCDVEAETEYLTLVEAFEKYAGIDLVSVLSEKEAFAKAVANAGIEVPEGMSWSDLFSAVLVTKIEPNLGEGRLTFLHRYPICEAALATACKDDPRFADRFELYACGVELANGFCELTDAQEQRSRFEADMDLKEEIYGERYPIDESFLSAISQMPPASGVAMGFDRLVMLATGASSVHDVIWTPIGQ